MPTAGTEVPPPLLAVRNPWIALDRGVDPAAWTRHLHTAYDGFLQTGDTPRDIRAIVADSWRRSIGSGIDPDADGPPVELTDDALDDHRAAHPLASALHVIRSLLVEDARDGDFIVAVTDASGRILWLDGESTLRSQAANMHFIEGAVWSESAAGTNAPGTALALDHPVQVFTAEHFRRTVQPWSCSAAPVHDPATGLVIGAIDVTGGDQIAAPQVLTLVRAAASAVESELALRSMASLRGATADDERSPRRLRRRRRDPTVADQLAVLGRATAVLRHGGREVPLSLRHSELLLLLAEHPEGRTGEQLTTDLHEHDVPPVTVRAELSRLRHLTDDVLGPGSLRSRPYRLEPNLGTDLSALRQLLRSGAYRHAVDRHAGAVLPQSVAPGVEALRHETHQLVRESLLQHADVDLLLRFAAGPAGRYDVGVWRASDERLPPGSPRRAAVRSHLAWIDRQLAPATDATSAQRRRS